MVGGECGAEMSAERSSRQRVIHQWAADTFGQEVAWNREERVLRFIEEAIELAQAEGLPVERLIETVRFVYAKPQGSTVREVGQVGVTLLAFCEVAGIDADIEERAEMLRVLALDREHFRARHNAKAAAGISTGKVPEK